MKTTIKINDILTKVQKNGKDVYKVYDTGSEKLSCFKDEVNKQLEGHTGDLVEVEITERNGYKNITGYYGEQEMGTVTEEKVGESIVPNMPVEVVAKPSENPYSLKIKQTAKLKHYWEIKVEGNDLQKVALDIQTLAKFATDYCTSLDPAERPEAYSAEVVQE
jgi:hypothetical protein